jgi:8-amino-7-oxononanoate synthase
MEETAKLQQVDRTYVLFENEKLSYFSGCDYYRLSTNPLVVAAAKEALDLHGTNVAASRLTTGNHPIYERLEEELAEFFDAESAVLVSNGYCTNIVVAQALAGDFSCALLDSRSHPALRDAERFLNCPTTAFAHRDASDLARAVRKSDAGAKCIALTDGLFAHDGSVAPMAQYREVLPHDALLLVDDAHGAGVLGASSQGSLEHCGVSRRGIVQTMSLSKAFGAFGGVIICSHDLRERIYRNSTFFQGSTPPPLPMACAALKSLEILRSQRSFRDRLASNKNYLLTRLKQLGVGNCSNSPGPILGFAPKSTEQRDMLNNALLSHRIYPPLVRYPGGPVTGYFRFAISSEHTLEQLTDLADSLAVIGEFSLV